MGHIRKDERHEFSTIDEAVRFVKNIRGKPRFAVRIESFLPTSNGKGFPGSTYLGVTRPQFIEVIEGMGRVLVDDRGGRVVVECKAPTYSSLSFISLGTS